MIGASNTILSYRNIAIFAFTIGKTTVSNILRKNCEANYDSLKDTYLRAPSSTSEWLHISRQFEETLNFPHTIGAIYGKNIRIECPNVLESLTITIKEGFLVLLYLQYVMRTIASRYLTLVNMGATTKQVFWKIQSLESCWMKISFMFQRVNL